MTASTRSPSTRRPWPLAHVCLFVLYTSTVALSDEPQDGKSTDANRADAPIYFERLINSGTVAIKFYDPDKQPKNRLGKTEYDVTFRQKHKYKFEWTEDGDSRDVTVTIDVQEFDVNLRHVLKLPRRLDRPGRWRNSLMQHEFDHVAISTDPRARLLLDRLCRQVGPLKLKVPATQTLDDAFFNPLINKEVAKRRDAVTDLIQFNYDELDRLSKHGSLRLPKRRDFFRTRYREENLAKAKFPYQNEVKQLLDDDAYKNVVLHYKDAPNF